MYTMKASVAVTKVAETQKDSSPTKSDNSIHRAQNESEMQLGFLRDVIGNIRRDGGTPSVESIATELSGMRAGECAPVLLALQQTHGNRYVQRVVSGIQAKLVVGQPGDVYEQEAHLVTDMDVHLQKREEREELSQTKISAVHRGQTSSLPTSSQGQIQWGNNAEIADADDCESAWSVHPKARSDSAEAPSWGASTASQAIGQPKPVSWGADQMVAGAKDSEMINEVIGVPVQKPLNVVQNLAFIDPRRLGGTTRPKNFKAPNFIIITLPLPPRIPFLWSAFPHQTAKAYEGDVKSYYIGPGPHKTTKKEDGLPVYNNASAAISKLIHDAEMEHCNDHKYAYNISLKEAEDVLTNYVVGKGFGPKPTKKAAEQMVLNTIQSKLTHPKLGNDKTQWGAKYKMLSAKTQIRDDRDWHIFDYLTNRTMEFQLIKGKSVATKVTYDIAKSKTTKINVVKSKTIITYI